MKGKKGRKKRNRPELNGDEKMSVPLEQKGETE